MVDGIGKGSAGLARQAIEAALKRQADALQRFEAQVDGTPAGETQSKPNFADALQGGVREVDQSVKGVDQLPLKVVRGEMDLHEATARIKESQLAFDFALEVRNKFIDAYREVMRMSV